MSLMNFQVVIVVGKSANGQNKQSQSNNTRFRSRKKDNAQEPVENTFHLVRICEDVLNAFA